MEYTYIEKIFERANLQQIRSFLLTGVDCGETDGRTYSERLKQSSKNIVERIAKISKDEDECDEILSELSDAESARTDVFLEIGMTVGAKLLFELLLRQNGNSKLNNSAQNII